MISDRSRPIVEATLPVVGEAHRRDRQTLLRAPVLQPPGVARRHLQPRQPDRRFPAAGAGRVGRRLRHRVGDHTRSGAGEAAVADRAQARVVGHPARPVPGRPRQPDVGHRGRAGRGGHAGGRGGVGRGLLADGQYIDQPGAGPVQRARGAAGDGVAPVAGREEDPGDRRCRDLRGEADRRPAGEDLTAGAVRERADADAGRGAPASPVQPDSGRRRRTPPVLRQAGARRRETRR